VRPAHVLALALVVVAVVYALAPPSDPDVWWHLRTGTWILDHHRLPHADPWSFTARGRPWLPHEWLSQVVITLAYRAGGYKGVSVLHALGVGTLVGALATQAFRRASPYRALLVTVAAVLGTFGGWGERPQLASFLLLIPVSHVLRTAAREDRRTWPLIPVVWLWANLHGLFFLAIALAGLTAFGVLLDLGRAGRPRARRLLGTALGMTVAAALTPNGPALLATPFTVRKYAKFVSEWDPPSIRTAWGLGLLLLLALVVWGWARSGRPVPRGELLYVGLATVLGLSYVRTVVVGAVLLVPVAARALGHGTEGTAFPRRVAAGFLGAVGLTGLAGAVLALATLPALPRDAPFEPVRQVLAQPGQHRVLDEYGLGGWLLWAAPAASPAIDGRTEVYPEPFVADYLNALRMIGDWQRVVRDLHADVAWLRQETPLVYGLTSTGWTVVWRDDFWVVLTPPPGGAR
jgi:hypothetical protein